MSRPVILILGGYGNTGFQVAELLLRYSDADVIIAGRNREKAHTAATQLNSVFRAGGRHISSQALDAAKPTAEAFAEADWVVLAAGGYTTQITDAVLCAGSNCLDLQYAPAKHKLLQARAPDLEAAGCCFITEAGLHPGVPAALVRYAASHITHLRSAALGAVIKTDWQRQRLSAPVWQEFLSALSDYDGAVFQAGRWQTPRWWQSAGQVWEFPGTFQTQRCYPLCLPELHTLPLQYPDLRKLAFYISGFDPVTDYLFLPLTILNKRLFSRAETPLLSPVLKWSLQTFSRPPYGTAFKLMASGLHADQPVSLELILAHPDAYRLTAIAAVACLLQGLGDTIIAPGLQLQALAVEPQRWLTDMAAMGAQVEVRLNGRKLP